MGTKKTIGYYRYNPNRPTWAINLGGILQGLSFFWGFCAVCCLVFFFQSIQYGTITTLYIFLGFLALVTLVVFNQVVGKKLAIGKDYHPRLPFAGRKNSGSKKTSQGDPALTELIGKLRERGVPDKDIADALRAVKSGEMSAKLAAEKLQAKAKVKK